MSESDFKSAVTDLRWALNRAISWVPTPDGEVIFTDDNGIQYSKKTMQDALIKEVKAGNLTPEQAKKFIKDNNINL